MTMTTMTMTRYQTLSLLMTTTALLMGHCCSAWTLTTSTHQSSATWKSSSSSSRSASLRMDLETPDSNSMMRRRNIQFPKNSAFSTSSSQSQQHHQHQQTLTIPRLHDSVPVAERSHGMPWKSSISPAYNTENSGNSDDGELFYMPFWEWQMNFMKEHLTNLRAVPVLSRRGQGGQDMSYVQNKDGTMRMHTVSFSSDEYKLIRMTVLDAGHQTQVFTSLWYPADTLQPVLGVDLLQFNHAKKHLCIVDFQPIVQNTTNTNTDDETDNNTNNRAVFEDLLEPVRNQYPDLQGVMTDRFYSAEDSYFSNQMLLGRHSSSSNSNGKDDDDDDKASSTTTARDMVFGSLFPAYQQYVATHVALVQQEQQQQTTNTTTAETVQAAHAAYDTYSAARDPAHALLARAFGQEWADDYVYDILFPAATRD